MQHPIQQIEPGLFPSLLREIPDPPEKLYLRGKLPETEQKILAIVGSRKYSRYGREALEHLVSGLRGHPITIVSGLALGIDALAHQAALDNDLHTVAVLGSGLDDRIIYPRTNTRLARKMLERGGALISEYEPDAVAAPWAFPRRNRIVAGMSHAVLIVEATLRSGTLITARLGTEYNRDVLTIPGSIFSSNTAGPHMLLRLGATPVSKSEHILEALGIEEKEKPTIDLGQFSKEEVRVLNCLHEPKSRDDLIRELSLDTTTLIILLSGLEIRGTIHESGGLIQRNI